MVFSQHEISEYYSEEKKYESLFKTPENLEWYNSNLYSISGGKIEAELNKYATNNPLINNTASSKWKHANTSRYAVGAPVFKDEQTNIHYYNFKDKFLKIELGYLNFDSTYYLEVNDYSLSTTEVNACRHFYFVGRNMGLQYRSTERIVKQESDELKIKQAQANEFIRESEATRNLELEYIKQLDISSREEQKIQNEQKLQEELLAAKVKREEILRNRVKEKEEQLLAAKAKREEVRRNREKELQAMMLQARESKEEIQYIKEKELQNKILQERELQEEAVEERLRDKTELENKVDNINSQVDAFVTPFLEQRNLIQSDLEKSLTEAKINADLRINELNQRMNELLNSVKEQNKVIQKDIVNSQIQLNVNNEILDKVRGGLSK